MRSPRKLEADTPASFCNDRCDGKRLRFALVMHRLLAEMSGPASAKDDTVRDGHGVREFQISSEEEDI